METKNPNRNRLNRGDSNILVAIFNAVTATLSPLIRPWKKANWQNKYAKLLNDVQTEMQWTITNLNPNVKTTPGSTLEMGGRYATVALECPNYTIWITREFYRGGDDLCVDVASASQPHQRVRIDVFAKREGLDVPIPATLMEVDSLVSRLDSKLSVTHF
jgi:hypothetical protein